MRGLIRKNLYQLRNPIIILFGVFFLFIPVRICFDIDESSDILSTFAAGFFTTMLGSLIPIEVLFTERDSGMMKWILTAPVTKKNYILEKYLLTVCFTLAYSVTASMPSIVFMVKTTGFNIKDYLLILSLFFCAAMLLSCITMPVIIKFGTAAGLSVYLTVFMMTLFGIVIFSAFTNSHEEGLSVIKNIINTDKLILALINICIMVIAAVISITLSLRALRKKQF